MSVVLVQTRLFKMAQWNVRTVLLQQVSVLYYLVLVYQLSSSLMRLDMFFAFEMLYLIVDKRNHRLNLHMNGKTILRI